MLGVNGTAMRCWSTILSEADEHYIGLCQGWKALTERGDEILAL